MNHLNNLLEKMKSVRNWMEDIYDDYIQELLFNYLIIFLG